MEQIIAEIAAERKRQVEAELVAARRDAEWLRHKLDHGFQGTPGERMRLGHIADFIGQRLSPEVKDGELLPCPFCGDEARAFECGGNPRRYRVCCDGPECLIDPMTESLVSEAEAIAAWNTRARKGGG